jgi:cytochrome c
MTFAGLPKPEERAAVLAYLNKQSDQPIDLAAAK